MLQITVNTKLCYRQYPTGEVKEDLVYGPADRGSIAVVRDNLWSVFYERDEELDVRDRVDLRKLSVTVYFGGRIIGGHTTSIQAQPVSAFPSCFPSTIKTTTPTPNKEP